MGTGGAERAFQRAAVSEKRIRRLLKHLGIQAIYPKPNTSGRHPKHPVYPYLLKDVKIIRPNQVWAADITYIRLGRGFCYLVAVMDWFSRYVLSWRLSGTMECGFCIEALSEALKSGKPDIFNSDQGSQFTASDFTAVLKEAGVRISMDGKGSYHDNIFVERLWRTVKYEEVFTKEYSSLEDARDNLAAYFAFYNDRRHHQALAYKTPRQVYSALARPEPMDMMDNRELRLRDGNALRSQLSTSPQVVQPQVVMPAGNRIRNFGPLSAPVVV